MVPDTSRPSMSPLADVAPHLTGCATCPSCHTADSRVTNLAVSGQEVSVEGVEYLIMKEDDVLAIQERSV